MDGSKKPLEVYQLDLSESKQKQVIHTQQTIIEDICFVHDGDKQLLIIAVDSDGLFAYNTETNKLEWKMNRKQLEIENEMLFHGVTMDGRGHLFVTDYNNKCVQMFSASDGHYLGRLMKGVETLFKPAGVYWTAETSSLVAACILQGKWHLQCINIQY